MMTAESLNTPAYDQFEVGTLELHSLIREGKHDSAEAEALRDRLAGSQAKMTPEQRRFGSGLSADLYMLNPNDGEVLEPATDGRSAYELGLAIKAAWDCHDWAAALSHLRQSPRLFPPNQVAFLRARANGELGRPSVALAFIRHAQHLDPSNTTYPILEMEFLARSGRVADVTSLAWQYLNDPTRPARILSYSASHVFLSTRHLDDTVAQPILKKLTEILRPRIERLQGSGTPEVVELLTYAHMTLGACLEGMGRFEESRAEYEAALLSPSRHPDDVFLQNQLRAYLLQQFGNGSTTASSARFDLFDLVTSTKQAAFEHAA